MYRIGMGFDAHRFSPDRKLMLGGIQIEYDRGLLGHSDADVLLHALCDALLGAAGQGDIGTHFPDTDPVWKDAASSVFVQHVMQDLRSKNWNLENADLLIIAQEPKIAPYKPKIRASVAAMLGVPEDCVNVKATTTDRMGTLGRGEGMAAQAVVLLRHEA